MVTFLGFSEMSPQLEMGYREIHFHVPLRMDVH